MSTLLRTAKRSLDAPHATVCSLKENKHSHRQNASTTISHPNSIDLTSIPPTNARCVLKSNPSCTLIQFPCSGNICLKCLPNSATACEAELPDQIYRYALQLSCPLCQQMHELDPEIGMMIYIANKPRCWVSQ